MKNMRIVIIITILIFFILQQLKTLQPDKFTINIVFATTFNKFQGQTLKRFEIYPPSAPCLPMPNSMWHFPDPLYLATSLLKLLKGTENV